MRCSRPPAAWTRTSAWPMPSFKRRGSPGRGGCGRRSSGTSSSSSRRIGSSGSSGSLGSTCCVSTWRWTSIRATRNRSWRADEMSNPMDSKADRLQEEAVQRFDPQKPLAVFLVGGEHDLGAAALRVFQSSHGSEYRQILFLSVGVLDYGVMDAGGGEHVYDH